MGRMFRIISESHGSIPAPLSFPRSAPQSVVPQSVAPLPVPPSERLEPAEVIPFVEVGGPRGVVTSIPFNRNAEPPQPAERAAVPESVIPPPAAPVRVSPEPERQAALSVAIHRFYPRNPQLPDAITYDDLIVVHDPQHPVSSEYRAIAAAIQEQIPATGSRTLLLTAALPTSGTTTVITNLAAILAAQGRGRVALLDANLLRPTIAERFQVRAAPGLVELLDQTVPLAWVVQPTFVERLSVITAGQDLPASATSLQDIPRLLAQLQEWFDWILIDAGVWSESIAGDVLAPAADGTYFICRDNQVDPDEFAGLRDIIEGIGGHPRGYVTTRG
ncbi:MAG: hypothetical protein LC104_08100 [Bacteroidales bacterium]|nr:hypothetical protein [Bacteroidales bacterium]